MLLSAAPSHIVSSRRAYPSPSVIPYPTRLPYTQSPSRLPYLILATVIVFTASGGVAHQCKSRLVGGYNESDPSLSSMSNLFTVYEDSSACVKEILRDGGQENSSFVPWNPCRAEDLEVVVGAHAVILSGNFLPFVNLNLSVTVFDPDVESVFLRFECVHAPHGDDHYCHSIPANHSIEYGRTIWPCRGVRAKEGALTPYTFSFDCFRLFAYSRYLVNVTSFPSGCSSVVSLAMPTLGDALPIVHAYYMEHEHDIKKTPFSWTPILIVDLTSSDDGVWLRFFLPEGVRWNRVTLSLYEESTEENPDRPRYSSTKFVRQFYIDNDGKDVVTGVKWSDAPKGRYEVLGHVPRHDCLLSCEGQPKDANCQPCPSNKLPFTLERDYFTERTRVMRQTRDVAIVVFPSLLVIITLCTAVIAVYVSYVRKKAKKRVQEIALVHRPQTLLLYSDDCPLHEHAVKELATVLTVVAAARVSLDQEELVLPGVKPIQWLVDQLVSAEKILVLLSPSTPLILARPEERLRQHLPFPDMFRAALPVILKELTSSANNPERSRIAFLRLRYSPPLPQQFALFGARCYDVPSNLGGIISLVHNTENPCEICHDANLSPLNEAVDLVEQYMKEQGAGWLERKMERVEDTLTPLDVDISRIQTMVSLRRGEVLELEAEIAKEQGLTPPEEDYEGEMREEEEDRLNNMESGIGDSYSRTPVAGGASALYRHLKSVNPQAASALLPPSDSEESDSEN